MKELCQNELFDLLEKISKNDTIAFCQLFDLYSPKVNAFAVKLTHNPVIAEEIVQDVFMKIWIKRETLTNVDNISAYLFTIVRNNAFNVLKRIALEEKAKKILAKELPRFHQETEEGIQQQESQQILNQAIDRLPPQQRLVYSLCYQEGLKYEEVAQRLNISRLTVKAHMQHALRNIKSHLSSLLALLIFIVF